MKRVMNLLTMLVILLIGFGLMSCQAEVEEEEVYEAPHQFDGETWLLCKVSFTYSWDDYNSSLIPVSSGEYMSFTEDTVYWKGTTYTYKYGKDPEYTETSEMWVRYVLYDSYGGKYTAFDLSYCSDSKMCMEFEDGFYYWFIKPGCTEEVTVNYDANGGKFRNSPSTTTQQTASVTYGSDCTIQLKTAAQMGLYRSGYICVGWTWNDSTDMIPDGGTITATGWVTLYAVWRKVASYKITFNANGGSLETTNQYESGTSSNGNLSVKLNSSTILGLKREGYIFKGWATSKSATSVSYSDGATITISSDKTLYAVWASTKSFFVIFNENGGSLTSTEQLISGESVTGSLTAPLKNAMELGATRNGFKLIGWSTSASSSSVSYADGENITLSNDVTLYAVWDRIVTYTITYDANGGSMQDPSPQTVTGTESEGASVYLRSATCSGWFFAGWAKSSSATTPTYTGTTVPITIHSDLTLYAVWKLPTYTVTFKQTSVFNSSSVKRSVEKGSYTLPTASSLGLNRTGYIFLGWSTSSGSSSYYSAGNSIEITRDTTLYGIWQEDPNPHCYVRLFKPSHTTNNQNRNYGPVTANIGGSSILPNNGYNYNSYTSSYYEIPAIGKLSYSTTCSERWSSLQTGNYQYNTISKSGSYTFEYGKHYKINCYTGAVTLED